MKPGRALGARINAGGLFSTGGFDNYHIAFVLGRGGVCSDLGGAFGVLHEGRVYGLWDVEPQRHRGHGARHGVVGPVLCIWSIGGWVRAFRIHHQEHQEHQGLVPVQRSFGLSCCLSWCSWCSWWWILAGCVSGIARWARSVGLAHARPFPEGRGS